MTAIARTRRTLTNDDEGSVMMEALVAMVVITTVALAFVNILIASSQMRTANEARDKANEILNASLERARQVTWADLGLFTSDGASAGSINGENSVILTTPAPPARMLPTSTTTVGSVTYTITTHVTWTTANADSNLTQPALPVTPVTNPSGTYSSKRVTVTVTWTIPGSPSRTLTGQTVRAPDASEQVPARVGDGSSAACSTSLTAPGCTISVTGGNTYAPIDPGGTQGGPTTVDSVITATFTTAVAAVTATASGSPVTVTLVSPNNGKTWVYTIAKGASNPFFGLGSTTITITAALIGGGTWTSSVPATFYQPLTAAPATLSAGSTLKLTSAGSGTSTPTPGNVTGTEPAASSVCVNSATGAAWYGYGWVVDLRNYSTYPATSATTSQAGTSLTLTVSTPTTATAGYNPTTGQVTSGPTAPTAGGLNTYRRVVSLPAGFTAPAGTGRALVTVTAVRAIDGQTPGTSLTAPIQRTTSAAACT